MKVFSIRPNAALMSIMSEIAELDLHGDSTRTAIFERAVIHAKTEKHWNDVFNTKITETEGITVPDSFQVKAEEEDMLLIGNRIVKQVPDVHKLHTVLAIRLILTSYLLKLRRNATKVGKSSNIAKDLTAPELVSIFVDLLMKNRAADEALIEDIKTKLVDWKDELYS